MFPILMALVIHFTSFCKIHIQYRYLFLCSSIPIASVLKLDI